MISKAHLDGVDDVGGEVGGAELLLGAVAELEEGLLAARQVHRHRVNLQYSRLRAGLALSHLRIYKDTM